MKRKPIEARTAELLGRRYDAVPMPVPVSRAVAVIDRHGAAITMSVSLALVRFSEPETLEALDTQSWTVPRYSGQRANVTAAFCGDPPYERSALFERRGE